MTLKQWARPDCYFGEEWYGWYVGFAQTRDSDCLEQSNFRSFLRLIGWETDTVRVIRENHWACGWVEWIGIHESDTIALEKARAIIEAYKDYPVVNEEDYSNLEWETACNYWREMPLNERIHYCKKYDVSIFAARRDELPDDSMGELISALAG